MNINDLYKRLETIFVDYTTHNWKNGWQHEGDRLSKELDIQKSVPWNNLFLLQSSYNELSLDGPQGFEIDVKKYENLERIKINIETKQMADVNLFYYVDNELDWLDQQDFICDLCQNVYNANILLRESISVIPKIPHNEMNPKFVKSYRRKRQLVELGM